MTTTPLLCPTCHGTPVHYVTRPGTALDWTSPVYESEEVCPDCTDGYARCEVPGCDGDAVEEVGGCFMCEACRDSRVERMVGRGILEGMRSRAARKGYR